MKPGWVNWIITWRNDRVIFESESFTVKHLTNIFFIGGISQFELLEMLITISFENCGLGLNVWFASIVNIPQGWATSLCFNRDYYFGFIFCIKCVCVNKATLTCVIHATPKKTLWHNKKKLAGCKRIPCKTLIVQHFPECFYNTILTIHKNSG